MTVLYYVFDLLYLDGYDWRRVPLEERKRARINPGNRAMECATPITTRSAGMRYSRSPSRRDRRHRREKAIQSLRSSAAAATGSRLKFDTSGSQSTGYYEDQGQPHAFWFRSFLACTTRTDTDPHVGQAEQRLQSEFARGNFAGLRETETNKNPILRRRGGAPESELVKPRLVAEIEFAEWTGGTNQGQRTEVAGSSISGPARR